MRKCCVLRKSWIVFHAELAIHDAFSFIENLFSFLTLSKFGFIGKIDMKIQVEPDSCKNSTCLKKTCLFFIKNRPRVSFRSVFISIGIKL